MLLTNPIYIGQTRHKDMLHRGEHEAIVPIELFERVQRQRRRNADRTRTEHRNRHGALLRGLLFCKSCSRAMSHTFTAKGTKRYRYYACSQRVKRGRAACATRALPAGEIERLVVDELRAIGRDPALVADVAKQMTAQVAAERKRLETERRLLRRAASPDAVRLAEIEARLAALHATSATPKQVRAMLVDFDRLWGALTPREQARLVRLLVARVEFDSAAGDVAIALHADGLRAIAAQAGAGAGEAAA